MLIGYREREELNQEMRRMHASFRAAKGSTASAEGSKLLQMQNGLFVTSAFLSASSPLDLSDSPPTESLLRLNLVDCSHPSSPKLSAVLSTRWGRSRSLRIPSTLNRFKE